MFRWKARVSPPGTREPLLSYCSVRAPFFKGLTVWRHLSLSPSQFFFFLAKILLPSPLRPPPSYSSSSSSSFFLFQTVSQKKRTISKVQKAMETKQLRLLFQLNDISTLIRQREKRREVEGKINEVGRFRNFNLLNERMRRNISKYSFLRTDQRQLCQTLLDCMAN